MSTVLHTKTTWFEWKISVLPPVTSEMSNEEVHLILILYYLNKKQEGDAAIGPRE